MREFMTKVSDYLNERRNNPDRQEDRLAVIMIGAVAAVVIVLLLLVLWGHTAGERDRKKAQDAAEKELVSATYREEAAEYMAQNDGQEELIQEQLRQEYIAKIEYLNDKVEELSSTLTQVEQNLTETIVQYQEGDASLLEEISSLHTEVTTIVQNLTETQTKLYDLIDIVQIMNEETIPVIQAQIAEIHGDLDSVHTDISDLYTKIAALQKEDAKLWASIRNSEKALEDLSVVVQELLDSLTQVEQDLAELEQNLIRVERNLTRVEQNLTRVEQNLTETDKQYQEGDAALREEFYSWYTQVCEDIDNMRTNIMNLFAKTTDLEKEDAELWAGITDLERVLEEKLGKMAGKILQYRYDEGENTLYLEPYRE